MTDEINEVTPATDVLAVDPMTAPEVAPEETPVIPEAPAEGETPAV